jgi:CHAT domain-containing protein
VRMPKHLSGLIIVLLLMTGLVCFDRTLSVFSLAQSNEANNADAIRIVVGRLFESYQQEDLDKLISLWSEKSPFLAANKTALQTELNAYLKIVVKGFDIGQMKIDGDKATLRVTAELALTRGKMVKATEKLEKQNRTIELVNEGGIWKVWKFIHSEEELASAIFAAKTEEEQKALMEKAPDLVNSELAYALIRLARPTQGDQGSHQHRLKLCQIAYKIAEQAGDQWVMASALISAASNQLQIGPPEKSLDLALEYNRRSLQIGEEYGFKDVTAVSLARVANICANMGELSQAEEYYERGLALSEELGDHILTFGMRNDLGVIYRIKGNFVKALELLFKSLKMTESRLVSAADWDRLAFARLNIGIAFSAQNNFEQALVYHQRAIEAAEKAMTLGYPFSKRTKSVALSMIGHEYLQQGNHSLAMEYSQKGLKLVDEIGDMILKSKDDLISSLKFQVGLILEAENKTLQAIAAYQEALVLAEKSRDKSLVVYPLLCLGRVNLLRGDYRQALAFSERAVKSAEQTSQQHTERYALVIVAKAYRMLGQSEEARRALARAIDITEQHREQLAGSELDRQRSFEKAVKPYHDMVDLQIDQKLFPEAFAYAQQAKRGTLLELLQKGRINITKSASPAEQDQERQLNKKIVSLNRQITAEKLKSQPNEKRLAEVEEQLKKARLGFEAFQTTLYAAHPELKVQRGDIRPVSFDDALQLIPDTKTALLDFIVTDENVHLFVLTKDASAQPALNTYTVKMERKALAEKVERYRRRMENRDYDFQALSHELYDLLIKPAQKQLQNKTSLVISSDNVLWDLPFQTLLSPELHYLIEDAAISYTPSLSVLREMQLASKKKLAPAKASILALGNPALGIRSKELAKFAKMDAELQPLPEAADQVRALGRLYGPTLSKVYTGPSAREELVKEQSARYRILHLATHGILNDVSPMYSHVLLSQTSGKPDEDGLLEAWEMMNLRLNADLVVLAACETARGRAGAGEGVIGMSWALFVAGCPRTVVSQWKVEASSTTALMVEFHKRFKTRYGGRRPAVSTAEAMRQAALKVMRDPEYVHPFYWGGFVVVGDGN